MSWSEWHRFSTMESNPALQCRDGVYRVRITDGDRQPISIRRACEDDPEGIVYIGCGDLRNRVGLYMRAFKTNPKTRIQFHWVYEGYGLERIGKREGLEIQWRECEDCEDEERRLMEEYKLRTGDVPPGNLRKERRPPTMPATDVEEI